ncbi:MAG TPA: ABC transporter ATP-binding protein [Enhygromyxa sp.]|nr:ABC transporter ATP-binding protein [Enhygromyxa sp.]
MIERVGWPTDRLGAMLAALAPMADERHAVAGAEPPKPTDDVRATRDQLGRWLEHHAGELGLELEPIQVELGELERSLPRLGPALLLLGDGDDRRVLVLERGGRSHVRVIGPDLARHRVAVAELAQRLAEPITAPLKEGCDAILNAAEIPPARRERALQALLRRRAAMAPIEGIWQLRLPPEAPLARQLRGERVPRSLALTIAAHLAHHLLLLVAWWLIGRGVLQGRSDFGWLLAWALVLLSIVPLRALQYWQAGAAALRIGAVLKRRLLAGVLALDPDELRSRGIGRLLALVIESEAVESLAISTGLIGATALIDLAMAGWVLTRGAGGGLLAILLLVWVVVIALLAWRYTQRRIGWARARLNMTHALVERMVGHTTRLAQEPVERWHEREDAATAGYLAHSRVMDRLGASLDVLAPRGWTLLAVLGMWPVLVVETPTTATLALAFGGVLLGQAAFASLAGGLGALADLLIAWREVSPLVDAATRVEHTRARHVRAEPAGSLARTADESAPIIEARELVYRHARREQPILRGVELRIHAGERILLEGPSGGGKSTLAALLTGLRQPDGGLLLLDGLDRPSLGEQGWRERVAAAPQFHENHVLANTFMFNLLMGRRWPPRIEDVQLAIAVCEQLGLGPLLERMPAGMQQSVGESGWQLSHGERSRLFLARALLQGGELVILDESLAALDPDNQALALECAWDRAGTLLVIAHP